MYQNLHVIIIDPYLHTIEVRHFNSNTGPGVLQEMRYLLSSYWVGYLMRLDNTDWLVANLVLNVGDHNDRYSLATRRIRGRAIILSMRPTFEFISPLTTPYDLASKIRFCSPQRSKLRSILSGKVNSFYISGVRYLVDADAETPQEKNHKLDVLK